MPPEPSDLDRKFAEWLELFFPGPTEEEVGKLVGCSQSTVSKLRHGQRGGHFTMRMLDHISAKSGLNPSMVLHLIEVGRLPPHWPPSELFAPKSPRTKKK